MPAPEDFDDAHWAAAAGTWFAQGEWCDLGFGFWHSRLFRLLDAEQGADLGDVGLAGRTGQQAVMPDAVEVVGQDMDQEPADELGRGQSHDLLAVAGLDAVILPAEGDGIGIGADQAGVRDRDPVGVAAEIGQHGLRPAEGRFGIDHPLGFAERGESGREGVRVDQLGQIAEEDQLTGPVQLHQFFQKQASEQPRQNPHVQEEPGFTSDPLRAVWRQAAAWHDHVDVRMMRQRGAPGVQHAGHADPCAHALGIGRDGHHCFRRSLEQQPVDRPLVPVGDLRDLRRQCEDHVEILHRQKVLGPRRHPVARRRSLALWAMPVEP